MAMDSSDIHVGLVSDVVEMLHRSIDALMKAQYDKIDNGDYAVDTGFDLTENEYNALITIGNRVRGYMDAETEYRWDFIMTLIYRDMTDDGRKPDDAD